MDIKLLIKIVSFIKQLKYLKKRGECKTCMAPNLNLNQRGAAFDHRERYLLCSSYLPTTFFGLIPLIVPSIGYTFKSACETITWSCFNKFMSKRMLRLLGNHICSQCQTSSHRDKREQRYTVSERKWMIWILCLCSWKLC